MCEVKCKKHQQHVEVKGDDIQIIQEASTKTPKQVTTYTFHPNQKKTTGLDTRLVLQFLHRGGETGHLGPSVNDFCMNS